MTNKEKFKEIFGFFPHVASCVVPTRVCKEQEGRCEGCIFEDWWFKEYKPCFQMLGEYDEDK